MIFINNNQEYNPNKKRKILIVFDNMIADILNDKKLNPIVTELFIRSRKQIITPSCFDVPKNVKLNSMHYFAMDIPSKKKLQKIGFNNSSDIDFQDLLNPYKRCTEK